MGRRLLGQAKKVAGVVAGRSRVEEAGGEEGRESTAEVGGETKRGWEVYEVLRREFKLENEGGLVGKLKKKYIGKAH